MLSVFGMGYTISMNIIKKTTQATAQTIAKQVREQSNEILKSATTQIAPQLESRPNASPSPKIDTPNPIEIKKKEQELLNQWRARISEMSSDEARARQERAQTSEAWARQQEELMKEPESKDQDFVEAPGKPQHGQQKGAQAAIQQKQQKHELGRGAKN